MHFKKNNALFIPVIMISYMLFFSAGANNAYAREGCLVDSDCLNKEMLAKDIIYLTP